MFRRAEQMAQGKNEDELKQTAKNLCEQMGINMDDAINLILKCQTFYNK